MIIGEDTTGSISIHNEQKDGKTYQTISWDVSDYMLFIEGGMG
jgi:hypothetical protein